MTIQPAQIQRDENGYWSHPDFPAWDEGVEQETIDQWFSDNEITYFVDEFEGSVTATEEMHKAYYDDGAMGAPDWQPRCDADGAFLLSIHDTEQGPVAVFAAPNKP